MYAVSVTFRKNRENRDLTPDLDASAGGGPVIKVEFDATLLKTLSK